VGESEEYKTEVASRREAQELAALEAEQAKLLRPREQPSNPLPRAARNAAQPMPPGYNANLSNGAVGPSPAPAAAPQPQPPPLTDTEKAANAIGKIARKVGELEPQVHPCLALFTHFCSRLPRLPAHLHPLETRKPHSNEDLIHLPYV